MGTSFTASHRGGSGPPLVLLHGFTDTWRTWQLVLPQLEAHYDVLALTLAGHAGGPPIQGNAHDEFLIGAVEQAMDDAGFTTAHIAGNSLGGYLALQLAERGRARSVVALAPAGGWQDGDPLFSRIVRSFISMQLQLLLAAPLARAISNSRHSRRIATRVVVEQFEHIPREMVVTMIKGARACRAVIPMLRYARRYGWSIDPTLIHCPVRIVWGSEDRMLRWPAGAARYRDEWFPDSDWVLLEGVGHCPQLDVPERVVELIRESATESIAP